MIICRNKHKSERKEKQTPFLHSHSFFRKKRSRVKTTFKSKPQPSTISISKPTPAPFLNMTTKLASKFLLADGGLVFFNFNQVHASLLRVTKSTTPIGSDDSCTCGNGKAKIWGPGGPHTALIPAAELFNSQEGRSGDEDIEICFGPESNWRDQALECASGLMPAAEQQTAGMIRLYNDILDTDTAGSGYGSIATPLTMHVATL
jgi:hypothetical protein